MFKFPMTANNYMYCNMVASVESDKMQNARGKHGNCMVLGNTATHLRTHMVSMGTEVL